MVCDALYILGQEQDLCPKMDEVEKQVRDLPEDPDCKIIAFSDGCACWY